MVDNCGLTDEGMAAVLAGCLSQRIMRSVVLRNSTLGVKATKALVQNVERCMPHYLEELKLESCHFPIAAYTDLLQAVSGSSLETLSLVDINTLAEPHAFRLLL